MSQARSSESIPWQGVHHLALATPDLDATVSFYRDILGMRLLMRGETPGGAAHAFIGIGGGATLHFWQADVPIYTQPQLSRGFIPGALQHLSLRLPDEAALLALHVRLRTAGIDASDLFDQGPVRLFFFPDPHGLQLEAAIWRNDVLAEDAPAADSDDAG